MAKQVDWPKRFRRMRSRGKRQSIEMLITLPNGVSWWEIIKKTEPTQKNCDFWNDRRRDFESSAQKGPVYYRDYFPAGRNPKKVD